MAPRVDILRAALPLESQTSHDLRDHNDAASSDEQGLRSKKAQLIPMDYRHDSVELKRPSIQFQPSWEDFMARSQRVRALGWPAVPLPQGFPQVITGSRVWSGQDVSGIQEFIVQLSDADIMEIESALDRFKALSASNGPEHVSKDLFPLPSLGRKLESISVNLHNGRGVNILRGLDPKKYTSWENVVLFAGLTCYIGEQQGCQDRNGNVLTHIHDMAYKFGSESKRRPAFAANALPYHNDICDILAMYVQTCAPNGGRSMLSSSAAVYNDIAATRPDVIKALADPIWFYDTDNAPAQWPARSLLFMEPKHGPFFCFSRQKLTGSVNYPLSPTIPAMSEYQAEALDVVHFTAEKHGLKIPLQPGDMMLYNNLAVLHGREAFTSPKMSNNNRHILRLWLRNEKKAWQTPPGLARDWHRVFGDSKRREVFRWTIHPEDTDKEQVIGHKSSCL